MKQQIKELEAQLKVSNKQIDKLTAQVDSSAKAAERLAAKVQAGHLRTLASVAGHVRKITATAEKLQPVIDVTTGQPKYPAANKQGQTITILGGHIKALSDFVAPAVDTTANA